LQGEWYADNKQTDTEPTLAHVFLRRQSGTDFFIFKLQNSEPSAQ
jgi:hypothetical protein